MRVPLLLLLLRCAGGDVHERSADDEAVRVVLPALLSGDQCDALVALASAAGFASERDSVDALPSAESYIFVRERGVVNPAMMRALGGGGDGDGLLAALLRRAERHFAPPGRRTRRLVVEAAWLREYRAPPPGSNSTAAAATTTSRSRLAVHNDANAVTASVMLSSEHAFRGGALSARRAAQPDRVT